MAVDRACWLLDGCAALSADHEQPVTGSAACHLPAGIRDLRYAAITDLQKFKLTARYRSLLTAIQRLQCVRGFIQADTRT